MDLHVLYRDKDLMVVKKPAGVPSQPDLSGQESMLAAIQAGCPQAGLVHRLDTPTGGVMVFGLTPSAIAGLSAAVQDHDKFQKEYLAVIPGRPAAPRGVLTDFLYHDKRVNKSFVTDGKRKGSKEAILDYELLETASNGYSLLQIRLHTGRTHQIRVQFASRGFPLIGDGKYGSREKCPYIALWAYRLAFPHPKTGDIVTGEVFPETDASPWKHFQEYIYRQNSGN